jgi:hypothetical protein
VTNDLCAYIIHDPRSRDLVVAGKNIVYVFSHLLRIVLVLDQVLEAGDGNNLSLLSSSDHATLSSVLETFNLFLLNFWIEVVVENTSFPIWLDMQQEPSMF